MPAGSSIRLIADADRPDSHRGCAQSRLDLVSEPHPETSQTGIRRDRRRHARSAAHRTCRRNGISPPNPPRLFHSAPRLTRVGGSLRGEPRRDCSSEGQPGRLAYISEFIEEAKKSWLVQQTIERLAGRELEVAPLESSNALR
jgi:hypothetical protein